MSECVEDASIHDAFVGSDHCPISVSAKNHRNTAGTAECRYAGRFSGQKRIHTFFRSSSISESRIKFAKCKDKASTEKGVDKNTDLLLKSIQQTYSIKSSTTATSTSVTQLRTTIPSALKPSARKPSEQTWICERCSLINIPRSFFCEVCNWKRPNCNAKKSYNKKRKQVSMKSFLLSEQKNDKNCKKSASSERVMHGFSVADTKTSPAKVTKRVTSEASKKSWQAMLTGKLPYAPKCKAHDLVCVLRTVLKKGPNKGRKFYVCHLPNGKPV